jgi:hypothetical protein
LRGGRFIRGGGRRNASTRVADKVGWPINWWPTLDEYWDSCRPYRGDRHGPLELFMISTPTKVINLVGVTALLKGEDVNSNLRPSHCWAIICLLPSLYVYLITSTDQRPSSLPLHSLISWKECKINQCQCPIRSISSLLARCLFGILPFATHAENWDLVFIASALSSQAR